jgi:RNA polymerase sigma factor for flagellar operon FliA
MIATRSVSPATPRRSRRNSRSSGASHGARGTQSRRIMRGMSASDREALLTRHLGLVHHVARQLASRLSTAADLDELISAGSFGLIQAVDSFDRARGLSFSTYAVPRIRGAILDALRKQDHVSRNVRRRTREVARARDSLAGALRRAPTDEEVSRHMQVPTETLRKWEFDAESAAICSLDQPMRADPSGATLADTVADERTSIDDFLTREQEVAQLKRAIAGLKEQERTVLALSFFEELKLQEIATVLGLSVCRISQIRTAALAKLRIVLSDLHAA